MSTPNPFAPNMGYLGDLPQANPLMSTANPFAEMPLAGSNRAATQPGVRLPVAPKPTAPADTSALDELKEKPSTKKDLDASLLTAADEEAQTALADLKEQRDILRTQAPLDKKAAEEYKSWLDKNPPLTPYSFKEEAPKFQDYAKETSPALMILTALGGKVGKLSGMNMIGAMTGMIKGTQEGNQTAFDHAYEAYKANYARAKEEHENMNAYHDAMMKYKKDQFGAEQEVSQQALAMMGVDEKMLTNATNVKKAYDKNALDLQRQLLGIEKLKAQTDFKRAKSQDDAIKGAQLASANFSRLSDAQDSLKKASTLVPTIISQFTKDTGKNPLIYPKAWNDWLTSQTGTQEQQAFVQYMRMAKPLLAALETGGQGQRSSVFLSKLVSESATLDVFSKSPTEIMTSINQLLPLVEQQKAQTQQWYDVWSRQAAEAGSPLPPLQEFKSTPIAAGSAGTTDHSHLWK